MLNFAPSPSVGIVRTNVKVPEIDYITVSGIVSLG